MKHYILSPEELEEWNRLFYDHLSMEGRNQADKQKAHKTKDENVVIGIPLKHPERDVYRSILLRDRYDTDSIFEDPQLPIIEGVHFLEALMQLGGYMIEEKEILFRAAYLVGLDKFSIRQRIMKEEKHASVELGNPNHKTLGGTMIGNCHAAIYKDRAIIGGGVLTFGISPYTEDLVEEDLNSGIEYKVQRAQRFLEHIKGEIK